MLRSVCVLAAVLGLGGCELLSGPEECTDELRPAILLEIKDRDTQQRIAGAEISVTDGTFEEIGNFADDFEGPFPLAHERVGEYLIEVDKEGYEPWSRDDVPVARDRCHVRTAVLTAFLVPLE
jgi:hypothetical protein